MWRFEQKGLFAREKVPKWGICKPGARRAGREEGGPAARVRARNPNSLAFMGGEREPKKPTGRVQKSPAAKVRARKPNSLAFTGGEREPDDSAGRPNGFRTGRPVSRGFKNQKTLNRRTEASANSKFFSLHIISYL